MFNFNSWCTLSNFFGFQITSGNTNLSFQESRLSLFLSWVELWFIVARELLSQMLWAKVHSQSWKRGALDMMLLVPEVCLAHSQNRGMGILEKSSNFPALHDTAPPMALLSPLHPCVRRALAAPWALLVATFLVPGWKWKNLHFRCIALLVSGWMHWVTQTTVVLQKSHSAWPGPVSEEMFFYSNTWSFTVLR